MEDDHTAAAGRGDSVRRFWEALFHTLAGRPFEANQEKEESRGNHADGGRTAAAPLDEQAYRVSVLYQLEADGEIRRCNIRRRKAWHNEYGMMRFDLRGATFHFRAGGAVRFDFDEDENLKAHSPSPLVPTHGTFLNNNDRLYHDGAVYRLTDDDMREIEDLELRTGRMVPSATMTECKLFELVDLHDRARAGMDKLLGQIPAGFFDDLPESDFVPLGAAAALLELVDDVERGIFHVEKLLEPRPRDGYVRDRDELDLAASGVVYLGQKLDQWKDQMRAYDAAVRDGREREGETQIAPAA